MRIRRIRSRSSGPRLPTRFWPASRDSPSAPPTRGPYNFCHEPLGQDTRDGQRAEYGIEAMIRHEGELLYARRFETRDPACRWAEKERETLARARDGLFRN